MMPRTSVQKRTSSREKGYPQRYNDGTNKSAPRRCVNTVNPRGLADLRRSRLMSHSSTLTRRCVITQLGGF